MTYVEPEEDLPPVAGATIVYLGPVAPHWDIRRTFGEVKIIDDFRTRVNARLLLLPKHDPQFRRNRERVNRDSERELIHLEWDLGDEDYSRSADAARKHAAQAAKPEEVAKPEVAAAEVVETAPAAAEEVAATEVVETAPAAAEEVAATEEPAAEEPAAPSE